VTIHSPHLLLRPWAVADAAFLREQADDDALWTETPAPFPLPLSIEAATAWIRSCSDELHFAIAIEDRPIGGASLMPTADDFLDAMSVGFWVRRSHWSSGIATEALSLLVGHATSTLGQKLLRAEVSPGNVQSIRVLEKNGFRFERERSVRILPEGTLRRSLVYAHSASS
jgi:[ribosomal protein S5]-alanine N-acetyltransferase